MTLRCGYVERCDIRKRSGFGNGTLVEVSVLSVCVISIRTSCLYIKTESGPYCLWHCQPSGGRVLSEISREDLIAAWWFRNTTFDNFFQLNNLKGFSAAASFPAFVLIQTNVF